MTKPTTHRLAAVSLVLAILLAGRVQANEIDQFGNSSLTTNRANGMNQLLHGAVSSQLNADKRQNAKSEPNDSAAHAVRYVFSEGGAQVTDQLGGITWRRCAEGMSWNGEGCVGQAKRFNSLSDALAHARSAGGWRLPTIEELITIGRDQPFHANARIRQAAIEYAFPSLPAAAYWSSTLFYKTRGDRDRTKVVLFPSGQEAFRDNGEGGHLLLVKSGALTTQVSDGRAQIAQPLQSRAADEPKATHPTERFSVSEDGQEVIDTSNRLVWRRCAEGMSARKRACEGKAATLDFAGAVSRAQSQAKSTGKPWRLPTKRELLAIGDEKRFGLAIDTNVFPATPAEHFWTSDRVDDENVFAVNFYNAFPYTRYQTNRHYVRLVRDLREK